eukprot:IDg5587t1
MAKMMIAPRNGKRHYWYCWKDRNRCSTWKWTLLLPRKQPKGMQVVCVTLPEHDGKAVCRKRRWELVRNDPSWLFSYALRPDFTASPDWRAMFRIPFQMFQDVSSKVRLHVQRSSTSFRAPLLAEKKVAAFLMMASSSTYRRVANQLGMGPSSVHNAVRDVSRAVCTAYASSLALPTSTSEIASIMRGFQRIAGLPYCVGAIDGSHIPWKRCPRSQFYEYRCYKGFESIIIFALASSDRRIIYADIGNPGVLSDSTLYERSTLRFMLSTGQWCGADIPSLFIDGIEIRPYIMGDGAFSLSSQVMKTCSKAEMAKTPDLADSQLYPLE